MLGWCRSAIGAFGEIRQLDRWFSVDRRGNLHPKTPEIEQLGQGLFNAGLTFKIGSVFVKLQLGKVNHILENPLKIREFDRISSITVRYVFMQLKPLKNGVPQLCEFFRTVAAIVRTLFFGYIIII